MTIWMVGETGVICGKLYLHSSLFFKNLDCMLLGLCGRMEIKCEA